jgi:hypothetical protein
MKNINYLLLLFATINFSSCSTNKISINKNSFGQYPAVFVNLSSGSLIKFDNDGTLNQIDADLWIEPSDPEIKGLQEFFERIKHNGENVLLRVLKKGQTAKELKALFPDGFKKGIGRSEIKPELKFIVHSSDKSFYSIKIISLNKEEKEMKLKLKYQKIE